MKRAAALLLPPLVCLIVFWDVLFTWFLNDDFAWLGLRLELHRVSDLPRLLFEPQAQGTVRFLSERMFFLIGTFLFGVHAVPFRLVGLATWFVVLVLASLIGTRLTGSRVAGYAAAIFWTTSYALVTPLAWSSAYNQLLCSLLVLMRLLCAIEMARIQGESLAGRRVDCLFTLLWGLGNRSDVPGCCSHVHLVGGA